MHYIFSLTKQAVHLTHYTIELQPRFMCGRASLGLTEKQLEKKFGLSFYSDDVGRYNPLPNYNIAPTHYIPIITDNDQLHFQYFKWGLLPSWAKDEKYGSRLINARIETADDKASFKQSFLNRRCLIPVSGYYEWIQKGGMRYPFHIVRCDREVFLLAGIWNIWKGPNDILIPTFTIITRDADEELRYIHDRMPGILPTGKEKDWLDSSAPIEVSKELLYQAPIEEYEAYPVSDKVNSVRNNDISLIAESSPPEIQQSLF